MARPAVGVGLAQRDGVSEPYPQVIGILRPGLVREPADNMTGGPRAKLPAVIGRETGRVVVQLPGRYVRRLPVEILAAVERIGQVADQSMLVRIATDHVSAAKIRFPCLEDRTEIQVHDV